MRTVLSSLMTEYGYRTPQEIFQLLTFKQISELFMAINERLDHSTSLYGYKIKLVLGSMFGKKEESRKLHNELMRPLNSGTQKAIKNTSLFAGDFSVENQKPSKSKSKRKKHGN